MNQHNEIAQILWKKLKKGDINALGKLYDLFIDELFAYGMRFSGDQSQVMDCIHDLFLNLYKYRKNLADTDHVDYYLMRALKNSILKNPQKNNVSLPQGQQKYLKTIDKSIEDNLIAEEFSRERSIKLANAIKSLSKKQRKGLKLRFTEEYSYEEIAHLMNISVETSRTLIYRAIKALRKEL